MVITKDPFQWSTKLSLIFPQNLNLGWNFVKGFGVEKGIYTPCNKQSLCLNPLSSQKGVCVLTQPGNKYLKAPWTPSVIHRAEQGSYVIQWTLQWDRRCPAYQEGKAYASQQELHRQWCFGLLPQTGALACGLVHSLGLELDRQKPFYVFRYLKKSREKAHHFHYRVVVKQWMTGVFGPPFLNRKTPSEMDAMHHWSAFTFYPSW